MPSAWRAARPPAAWWFTHSSNQSLSRGLARCSGGGAHAGGLVSGGVALACCCARRSSCCCRCQAAPVLPRALMYTISVAPSSAAR
eukprot:6267851-Lingulodinium_polyedra.AAC.1